MSPRRRDAAITGVAIRAFAAALVALALLPASASAHAVLQFTSPERGARLDAAPEQVTLRFSEPVEVEFGAVRVFDSKGREVQTGRTFHPDGRTAEVAVRLRRGLGEDGYTATYRVISADSHPVSGGFVFVVGDAAAPATAVTEFLSDDASGAVTSTAFGVARAVQFAAIALGLGALIFALACWLPGLRATAGAGTVWATASIEFARRLRVLVLVAAIAGIASGVAALVLQGAVAAGTTAWAALDPDVIHDVLSTRFGAVWALGLAAWQLVVVLAAPPDPVPILRPAAVGATGLALPGSARLAALAAPLVALAALPALGGHAGVQSPVAVLLPANVAHVMAMAAWFGGIVVLVYAVRAATECLEPVDGTRLLAAVITRFSVLAGVAIAVLLASGTVQGLIEVRTLDNLIDTAFGRVVLVKLALVAAIVALGAANRRRLLPALTRAARDGAAPGRAGQLLRRTLAAELVLGAVALAATGALAGYAPATAAGTGPFSGTANIGPARLELTVDPARTGPNQMRIDLFDRRDGRPYTATKELTVTAELAEKHIAPINLDVTGAGPGRYTSSDATLPIAGDWTIRITDRVSEFDEHLTRLTVRIQ